MRILVLGNKGMQGHVTERYLKEQGHDVIGLNRKDVDFRHDLALIQKIDEIKPEVVINCAGILFNGANIQEYTELNILLPHLLAKESTSLQYKLIHISTNCVFQGIGPHSPNEVPDATTMYGMSKAFGEINDEHNLTIRTSITGPELKENGTGLFNWFMKTNNEVSGYKNALWNGVTTLELAKFITLMLQFDNTGIIHYYSMQTIDKCTLLRQINEIYNLNKTVEISAKDNIHSSLLTDGEVCSKTLKEQFEELKEWY